MPRKLKTYTCARPGCGTEFTALDPRAKFCGKICRQRAWRRVHPVEPKPKPVKECANPACGKEFVRENRNQNYCGAGCRRAAESARRKALRRAAGRRRGRPPRSAPKERRCADCRTLFEPTPERDQFCSDECGTPTTPATLLEIS